MNNIIENFCTLFNLGKISKAPGTLGSIFSIMIGIIIIEINNNLFHIEPKFFLFIQLIFVLILFILGVKFSSLYAEKYQENDPKQVIIDEFVAQILTLFVNYYIILNFSTKISRIELWLICYLGSLILFRLFDIAKFWPINWVDNKVKGGIGIMLDDLLAAIFSILTFYVTFSLYIGR